MQFRQINLGSAGPSAGMGCGGLLFILGLILISPVGEFLVSALGWLFILAGLFIIATGIYLFMKGSGRGNGSS